MIHPSSFPIFDGMEKTIIEILNLYSYQSLIDQGLYTNFSDYLIPDHVPNLNNEVLNKVEKSISINIDFRNCFSSIKSQFIYREERINYYVDNFSKISKNQQLAATYLGYSVISFLVLDDIQEILSSFPLLIHAIFLSEKVLPRKFFVFVVSACLVHFLEDENSVFSLELAQQIFPKVTNKFFNLFSFVLLKTLKSTKDPTTKYLFQTFTDSVYKSPKKFVKCDFTNLVPYLSQKVGMLDSASLDVIDCLSFVKKNDRSLNESLESIPIFILYNSKTEFKLDFPDIKPFKRLECVQLFYQFEKVSYFTHGLNPLESELIDRTFPIDFDTSEITKSLREFLCKLENSYILYFFDHFTIKDDTSYLVYFRLLQKFGQRINATKNILKKLFHPIVFSPSVSLFDYNSAFDILYQFRKDIFDILLKTNHQLIIRLLKKLNFEPLLFCEFIGRLHVNLSSFDAVLLTQDTFINSIVQGMMIIKHNNSEIHQKARATLILFIVSILKDESNIRDHFYASTIFVNAFFTSIFEPVLHSLILSSFLHFLQKFNSSPEILKPSISMISSVINFCEDEQVALSILQSFTESLSVNPKIATSIGPFVNSITAYLYMHPSQDFLNETIQLYLHCEHKFEMRQIRDLSDSIHKINGENDPDDQLIMNLLCLISYSPSVSLKSRVLILNEQLLIAFFSLFQTSSKTKPIFEFLFELCKFSTFNCYQCSKAELDVLFIEMIKNYPNKFTFHGCQMNSAIIESKNQIIDILCYLICIRTSPSVCIKTISLFEQNFESTNIMNSLLSNLANIKKNIQPIGYFNSPLLTTSLVNGKSIDERFTFLCWIKVDSMICHRSDNLTTILQIIHGSSELSLLVNNNGSLIVKMLGNDDILSAMFMNRFPAEKSWTFITVLFKRRNARSCVLKFSKNCERPQVFTVEFPHFANGSLKVAVGKLGAMKPIKSAYPVFLGDYFFYSRKLKKEEITDYYRKGEFPTDYLFRNPIVNKSVFPNFLDHFLSKDVHLFILPYIYLNDDLPNLFTETLLDLLKTAVIYRPDSDIDFKSYAYALKRSDQITFSLYQKFFSMLDCCSNQKTLKSLLYDILLNFKIWKRAKTQIHLNRIVQNWGNILFNSCPLLLTNFSLIYSQIGIYFSFVDPDNQNLDLHLYRQNLDKLLFSVSTISFSYDNALAILSNCAASHDSVQNLYDLKLLLNIYQHQKDPPLSLCKLLFYFLRPKKEEQFVLVLKIIHAISKEKIFRFIDSIFCIFNEFYFTQKLLDLLVDELIENPYFYPIVIFIALNIEQCDLFMIASKLKTLKIPYFGTNWLLMPLLLYSKTKSIDVVMFCASNVIDHFSYDIFDQCLSYIDFLSCALNVNFESFSLNFAKVIVDLANCQNPFIIQHLFIICTKLLLTNTFPATSITPTFLTGIDETDFFDKDDFTSNQSNEFEFNFAFQSFIDLIQTDISNKKLYFRVSLNPLMSSSVRLFKKAVLDVPMYKYIYLFFQSISTQSDLNFSLTMSLNSMFPMFFDGELNSFGQKNSMIQSKLVDYWLSAKKNCIDFMTSFGSKEASVAVTNSDFILNNRYDKIVESKMRKVVLSEFSIWSQKKLYLTEIRRVFKYSRLLHQIRLKKSDNSNTEKISYSPESKQPPIIKETTSESSYGSNDYQTSNSNVMYQLKYNYPTVEYVENCSNETIIFKSPCLIIKIDHEVPANFVLKHDRFIITTEYWQKVIMLYELRYVFRRDRFQIDNSLEFILIDGRSFLLDFSPYKGRFVMKQFKHLKCKNLRVFQNVSMKEYFELTGLTEKWQNRHISNFEYLMALNMYSGRTFSDANLYPIFPWIMTSFDNYEDQLLSNESFDLKQSISTDQLDEEQNLTLKRSFSYDFSEKNQERNLKKPIAIQNSKKYNEINMKFDRTKPISHTNCFFFVAPSTTAMVSHWLLRQPPFTQLHCRIEDGKFGFSARLFQSMNRAAHQALRGSISWELCPEFFSFPEIFVNLNHYEMGNDVKKDIFSIEKAIDFVYFHRKMLENEVVSENLNHWIDLIFGCKTQDVPSGNVYTPIIKDNVWKTSPEHYHEDFIILTITTSGQLPRCLFVKPHPKRMSFVSPNEKMSSAQKNVPMQNLIKHEREMTSYEMKIHRILATTSKLNLKELMNTDSIQLLIQSHRVQQETQENEVITDKIDISDVLQINHAVYLKKVKAKVKRNRNENETDEEYLFLIELANGVICTLSLNFEKKRSHCEINGKRHDITEDNYSMIEIIERNKQKPINDKSDVCYSNFSNGFMVSNHTTGEIYVVKDSSIEQINVRTPTLEPSISRRLSSNSIDLFATYSNKSVNNEDCEFDSISASGDAFCLGNSDGHFEIYLLNELDAPKKSIDFLYERVACFAYSQSYGVIVCGCNNGSIYIIDSESGQVSFSHQLIHSDENEVHKINKNISIEANNDSILISSDKLNESQITLMKSDDSSSTESSKSLIAVKPNPILQAIERNCSLPTIIVITEGFGFIVVYCDDMSFYLFNINGFLIRTRKVAFEAERLFAFKSCTGFDYIVAADSRGGIRICEAYYLDFNSTPIYSCRGEIVSLGYDVSYDTILVGTKCGKFFRIPACTLHPLV